MSRILRFLAPLLGAGALLAGAFFLYRRHVEDKASRLPPPSGQAGPSLQDVRFGDKSQKERLEKALKTMEEPRRLNERSLDRPLSPSDPTADVQRTFKTIEDINRINRMNQELRQKQNSSSNSNPNPPK